MATFSLCFIPNLAIITHALRRLVQKGVKYEWTYECNRSFLELKTLIKQAKCLAHPDFTRAFCLQTDTSNWGIGVVLHQQVQDSSWQPITFISRALTRTETNYSTTEKDLLAILWAFNKLHPYLHRTEVIVETYHQPLVALVNKRHPPGRLLHWTLALKEYKFNITYRKGDDNYVADSLSRSEYQAMQFSPPPLTLPIRMDQMAALQDQDPKIWQLILQV
jgi:hypothetical protein